MRYLPLLLASLLAVTTAHAQDTAADYYEEALRHGERGDRDAAVVQLKNALQIDNTHIPSLLLFAELQLAVGNTEVAATTLSDALLLGADPGYAVPLLAEIYLQQARYRRLLDELDPQQLTGSARAELLGFHALALSRLGQEIRARVVLRQAEGIDPDARSVGMAQLTEMLDAGDLEAAQEFSATLVRRHYDDAAIWYLRASVLVASGDVPGAQDAFDQALELRERFAIARLGRAELALASGDLAAAATDVAYLVRNFPNDPRATFLEARLRNASGDEQGARESFTRTANLAAAIDEAIILQSKQLTVIAATAYREVEGPERAIELLQGFQQLNDEELQTGRMLADLLLSVGAGDKAVQVVEPLLRAFPESPGLRARMATGLGMRGDHRRATSIWQSLQRDGLDTLEIRAAIAESQVRAGDYREGVLGLERVLLEAPGLNRQRALLAETYLEGGIADRAFRNAQILVASDPDNPRYKALMGEALTRVGEPELAAEQYRDGLQLASDPLEFELALVRLDIEGGEFTSARDALLRLEEEHPDSADVQRTRARLEYEAGDAREARRYIDRSLALDGESLESQSLLVDIHFAQGQLREAIEVAANADRRFRADIDARFLHADTLARAGNRKDARVQYKLIARVAEITDDQLYRVAMAQVALGAYEDASASLFSATREAPNVRIYREAAVDVLLRMQNFDQALEDAKELSRAHPEATFPIVLVARAHLGKGEYAMAAQAFARAQAMEPENRDILLGRQRALVLGGEEALAQRLLTQWLASHPDDTVIRFTLAGLLLHTGQFEASRGEFEILAASGPQNPLVLNNLAYLQHELGDAAALDTARRAHELAPELSQTNDTLGWILVSQGSYADGLRYLREAVARRGDSATLHYHLGVALEGLGRTGEARQQLRTALDLGAEGEQRAAIESLLASME